MKKLISLFLIIIATLCLAIALPACKKEEEPFSYGYVSEENYEMNQTPKNKLNKWLDLHVGEPAYFFVDYKMPVGEDSETYTIKITVSPVQKVRARIEYAGTTSQSETTIEDKSIMLANFTPYDKERAIRVIAMLTPTQQGNITFKGEVLHDGEATENYFSTTKYVYESSSKGAGLSYVLNSDKQSYSVSGIGKETGDYIYVPGNYEGLPVTGILDNAFKNATFVEVTIADGIKKIGSNAFYGCEKLVSASIGTGLEEIGESAFKGCRLIRGINLSETLQSIGNSAFENCTLLRNVTIPSSVTSMGDHAFSSCSSLTSITVDEGNANYKSIDGNLYSKDGETLIQYAIGKSATSFEIPNSVTSIGGLAFASCGSLTNMEIPDSVTSIGDSAFRGCSSLESIILPFVGAIQNDTKNTHFGYIFGASSYSNNSGSVPSSLKSVTIIGGESIGYDAFYNCTSLTSITIPDSVTSIGSGAFARCASLESITLPFVGATKDGTENTHFGYIFGASWYSSNSRYVPESLKSVTITGGESIGDYAFSGCTSLTSITIPDGVTSIGREAFYSCSKLESITIPDSVKNIGDSAFSYCGSLTSITIPDGVTSIGREAFENCSSLESITIPNSVTSIGSSAFYSCSSLTSVTISDSVTSIGINAFYNCPIESATIPAGAAQCIRNKALKNVIITSGDNLEEKAFYGCNALESITIPDSVTNIGEDAFYNCSSLTSITIPDSVTSIGENAFSGCSCNIVWGDNPNITEIGNYAFCRYRGTSITIPDSVISIGNNSFSFCGLLSITIPDGVTSVGDYAFNYCPRLTILCEATEKPSGWNDRWNFRSYPVVWNCKNNDKDENGYVYTIVDGIKYSLKGGVATVVMQPSNITTANIPLTVIYKNATYNVTSIGGSAFSDCASLTSITIPDSVKSIGDFAFSNCSSLTNITIPNSVTSIGRDAFSGCSSLTSITIPNSVTSIGEEAFWNCASLININVDLGNVNYKSIDGNLYSRDGATLIRYALGKTATSFAIPDGVTSIGREAFYSCSKLESITIPDSVKNIGDSAFSYCTSLTSITIPNSVTSIGNYVSGFYSGSFSGCKSLTIYCEATEKPSDWDGGWNSSCPVVWNCRNNDKDKNGYVYVIIDGIRYSLKDGVATVIGQSHNITTANIPSTVTYNNATYNVTSIGSSAFSDCSSLESIIIPDSVTSMGEYAFSYCRSLTSITFNGTKEQWNAIDKGSGWNYNTGNYVIHCTDGDTAKS